MFFSFFFNREIIILKLIRVDGFGNSRRGIWDESSSLAEGEGNSCLVEGTCVGRDVGEGKLSGVGTDLPSLVPARALRQKRLDVSFKSWEVPAHRSGFLPV